MKTRFTLSVALSLVVVSSLPANAQRPGWGGWGPRTAAGDTARGAGVLAAGVGSGREQTAEARSVNTQTNMELNEYLYQSQQRRNQTYYANQDAKRDRTIQSRQKTEDRLRYNPEPRDVRTGDALNVVLDDHFAPMVYPKAVESGTQTLQGQFVKELVFQYASQAVAICLDDLSEKGIPDAILTDPTLQTEKNAVGAAIKAARKESEDSGQPSAASLAKIRTAIKALQSKADSRIAQGRPERREVDNFLKGLYGLTKMFEQPNVKQYIDELRDDQTTDLGQVLSFMHTFNLRFGPSETPPQQSAYDQLFPMLVTLRDQLYGDGSSPPPPSSEPQDTKKLTNYFSDKQ